MACSRDGKFVYTCAGRFRGDDAICVFERGDDGILSLAQEVFGGPDGVIQFQGGNEIVVAPDDRDVYCSGTKSNSVVGFRRNRKTGKLTWNQTLMHEIDGVPSLRAPVGLGISPDNDFAYITSEGDGAVSFFRR